MAVSQYGHSRHDGSSGALHRRQACFSLVPQCGHFNRLIDESVLQTKRGRLQAEALTR